MEKLLDTYLESKDLTRYKVSKETGISPTILQRAADKAALSINSRVLQAVGKALNKTPGQVLDDLIELEKLDELDSKGIISPYYISKAEDFFTMSGASKANPLELAKWAQTAEPMHFAIITNAGKVVGHGQYFDSKDDLKVPYVDQSTVKKYDLDHEILDMALAEISAKIGTQVIAAKESEFRGKASHKARTSQSVKD